jgi:hypothetical protein
MNNINESLKEMNLTEEQQQKVLSIIKSCTDKKNKELQKEWKKNHKNEIKEFNKNYYESNKQKILDRKKNKDPEFCCDACNYKTNNRYDFQKHKNTNKHINKLAEIDRQEEQRIKEKEKTDEEEKKKAMWKYSDAVCTNGCIYKRGEKGWSVDGINCEWLCKKCDDEECERLFGSKQNTIIN